MVPILHVQLFGDFRLYYDGKLVTNILQARLQSLLAYLLIHRASPQSRQKLAFLFWPDTAESQARTNLRQLLHHLKRVLPAANQFLQTETNTLQWQTQVTYSFDVAEFEQDLAQAAANEGNPEVEKQALESAVKWYGGDLLPGCYDDWILPERERLHQSFLEALERLIFLTEAQRDYRTAIGFAERLLRRDPLHESTYRRLMRLHALNGDRASALQVYHTCVTILARELGVEPHVTTQEAYMHLLNMEAPAVLSPRKVKLPSLTPVMVGRRDEWMMLRNIWRRVNLGYAAFVLISAEAGMGKTRLAEEFLEWGSQQGFITARTRSYAAEGRLAYAPVAEILRSDPLRSRLSKLDRIWLKEVARLVPELLVDAEDLPRPEPITDGWQRKHLFEALSRAMISDQEPRILFLDDLQWCDQDTLEWLHYLLHFDTDARLLIIGAVRPEEVDQPHPLTTLVLDLGIKGQITKIELGPLDISETVTLAEQVADKKFDNEEARRLYLLTEGNPLFIVEAIRAEVSDGEAKRWDVSKDTHGNRVFSERRAISGTRAPSLLPPKVQAIILARLRQLSAPSRDLASLAATIGRSFTTDVLAQASGSDEETLVQGLDELWQHRIIREQGTTAYDFSHDSIREVAYSEVSKVRRQALHKRVARALEQIYRSNLDEVSDQIADHFERAGVYDQAIGYYQKAAVVAQKTFSNQEVVSLLYRALQLLPNLPDSPERAQTELNLLTGQGTALMSTRGSGHPEVEQTFLRAWELCQSLAVHEQAIPVLAGLWICNNLKGDLAQQAVWAEHLKRVALNSNDALPQMIAKFALAGTALFSGDFRAARQYAEQALASFDIEHAGLPDFIFGMELGITQITGLALSLWQLGFPDQAIQRGKQALEVAFRSGHPVTIATALGMGTVVHQWCGDVHTTLSQAKATIDYAIKNGMPQWVAHGQILYGWALAKQGRIVEGVEQLEQGLAAWQAMGARLSLTYYWLLLAEVYHLSGQLVDGLRVVEQAMMVPQEGGETWFEAELYRRRGELLLASGEDEQVVEACFQRALEIAHLQQALSFKLRAAISLSRLWQRQGKHIGARQLLASVMDGFTEGIDTVDLRQAKDQLDSFG
jgi:DNA-binding SARP family transcriptional activator/predicted ATPase